MMRDKRYNLLSFLFQFHNRIRQTKATLTLRTTPYIRVSSTSGFLGEHLLYLPERDVQKKKRNLSFLKDERIKYCYIYFVNNFCHDMTNMLCVCVC